MLKKNEFVLYSVLLLNSNMVNVVHIPDFREGQFIVAGSDDGSIYFWDRNTTNNIRILKGDGSIVNCLQPHPTYCLLASSGIDPVVRLWSPLPQVFIIGIYLILCIEKSFVGIFTNILLSSNL